MANRYRALLRTPGVRPVLASGAVARLGVGMYGLALLLLAERATGSLARAGVVGAAAAAGYALAGPLLGRFADRFGPRRPLVASALANAASFALVLVVAELSGALLPMALASLLAGASIPPVAACQRALWRSLLDGKGTLLESALALDSLQLDAFLIGGPLLVTGLTVLGGPQAAVLVTAGLLLAGTLAFAALPACAGAGDGRAGGRGLGPLRAPGFRLLLGTIAAAGLALGAVRVSLVGFGDAHGDPALGGLLFTAIGIGSAASGIWYGSREWTSPVERRYTVLLAGYAACTLPLLTGFGAVSMFALAVLTGLALTPFTICEFALVGRCAPAATVAEAFAWGTTATFAGSALGSALGGLLGEQWHWRAGIALAVLVLAAAAAATRWGRGLLTDVPAAEQKERG